MLMVMRQFLLIAFSKVVSLVSVYRFISSLLLAARLNWFCLGLTLTTQKIHQHFEFEEQ